VSEAIGLKLVATFDSGNASICIVDAITETERDTLELA
jgi:hypothetical protein